MTQKLAWLIAALAIAGCGGGETRVIPVPKLDGKQVCIITNPKVRLNFVQAYQKALQDKGYQVQMLPDTARISACPITSTYSANWGWDLFVYLSFAQIIVYTNAERAGTAVYQGKEAMSAEGKIKELVDRLFPN